MILILVKIGIVLAGVTMAVGFLFPPIRFRHDVIFLGLIVLIAFLFAAIDHFHLIP